MSAIVNRSNVATHAQRLRWPSMLGGIVVAVLISHAAMTSKGHAHEQGPLSELFPSKTSTSELQPRIADVRPLSMGTYLPKQLIQAEKPFGSSTAFSASLPPSSPYFQTLTRIYGAPANTAASESSEPLPPDEVATFHQGETRMPIALARITSKFGQRLNPFGKKNHTFHQGIDMAAPTGTPVQAVAEGTVVRAAKDKAYGNVVEINHHNGFKTLYAHNSKLLVKAGDRIKAGHPIAKVGSTGNSTGPHLHFEIHRDGQRVDPYPYLAAL